MDIASVRMESLLDSPGSEEERASRNNAGFGKPLEQERSNPKLPLKSWKEFLSAFIVMLKGPVNLRRKARKYDRRIL